jgi:HPr kinase/phosphorylase
LGDTVHASVARLGHFGILIRGPSGSGKSSLLLALLDDPGAILVADDRVRLHAEGGRVIASVPEAIAGRMEIRGVGIVRRPYAASAVVDLVVDIEQLSKCPRLPTAEQRRAVLAGIAVRRIFVALGAPDGALRVRAALDCAASDIYEQDADI